MDKIIHSDKSTRLFNVCVTVPTPIPRMVSQRHPGKYVFVAEHSIYFMEWTGNETCRVNIVRYARKNKKPDDNCFII